MQQTYIQGGTKYFKQHQKLLVHIASKSKYPLYMLHMYINNKHNLVRMQLELLLARKIAYGMFTYLWSNREVTVKGWMDDKETD